MLRWTLVVMVLLALLTTACGEMSEGFNEGLNDASGEGAGDDAAGPVTVTEDEYGDDWPLTEPEGVLACDGDAVTITVDGRAYALNGVALQRDIPDVAPIQRDNPDIDGVKVSVAPLIDRGLELCE